METLIVKQEEEDWTCNFEGPEAELDVKTEVDQHVDLQSACGPTVPNLFNNSPTIKQEPTDSFEAVTSQDNSTLCPSPHYVCDATIVKVEDPITEAAVKGNDVWLQRLARAHREQEKSLQHEVNEENDKDEETAIANNTADRKRSIPVTVGCRKFVLVPRSTRNALAAATNTHKGQTRSQVPGITKFIIKVLDDKKNQIKSNLAYSIAQPPVAENVTTSILKPVLPISNTKPVSKVFSTAKPCLQPKHIQSPQKTVSNIVKPYRSIPDCVFQPKTKNKTSDITNTNLQPAMNNFIQHSVTNHIVDNSVAKNFMTPLIMTKKITPLEPSLSKQSQELLNTLEKLKASKRAEAFKKVTRVPVGTNHGKSPVANVKPIPQKTMKSNPTSVSTKIREILTYINSRLPIKAKATVTPMRFSNSIPTSQLEAFLRPCIVKLERLKLLTCALCRQQFYLKSQFVQHVFQHGRTPSIRAPPHLASPERRRLTNATHPHPHPRSPVRRSGDARCGGALMSIVSCNICGKYYQRRYLKIHVRKEHGPKNFWCDHCDKKCPDKDSLTKHLVTHSDIKEYCCDVCNKRFRRKSNLVSHLDMHSTDTPYKCMICDKQFRRKNGLSKHSLYHLAVRPHQCKICYKQFYQLAHLERHMLVHTGERPYACEICNMRFNRSSHRNRHNMNIHMSKKKYACKVCEKSFKERSRLEKHKRVHE